MLSQMALDVMSVGELVLKFGRVDRATLHPDGVRPETDTDHTVMLAVLAPALVVKWRHMGIIERHNDLNLERVISYAIVHDLVEAECGDTCSIGITPQAAKDKERRERAAIATINGNQGAAFSWVFGVLNAYERQQDPEARFIKYLDKVLPKITHTLNGGAALKRLGYTAETARIEHDKQIAKLAAKYPEFPMVHELLKDMCEMSERALLQSEQASPGGV